MSQVKFTNNMPLSTDILRYINIYLFFIAYNHTNFKQ